MELLTKFLSNQITLAEFLEKSEGKVYHSSKEGIEFMIAGLKGVIKSFNDSNTDYIRAELENRGSIIWCQMTYYKRKNVKETYTTKEEIIETIPFISCFSFKIQISKENIVNNNITYNYIGSNNEGVKYYLREVYYDNTISDEEFVEQYHVRLDANNIRALDSIYSYDSLTDGFIFEGHYSTSNLDISYNSPLSTDEYYHLNELLTAYPIIENSIAIAKNGTINNRVTLDCLKNETTVNTLIKTIRKIHEDLNKIFKR